MALIDYQKLCPKSGHALTSDERETLRTTERTGRRIYEIHCARCGRTVEVCPHPGTGLSLIYPMHLKSEALRRPESGNGRGSGGP